MSLLRLDRLSRNQKLALLAVALGLGALVLGGPRPGKIVLDERELAAIVEGEVDHVTPDELAAVATRDAGNVEDDAGAGGRRGVDLDGATELLHDAVDRGEPEPGAACRRLRREERLEGLLDDVGSHALPAVTDLQTDIAARRQPLPGRRLFRELVFHDLSPLPRL